MDKPQILAFYLPQYHPFKENDEWWGKGFTEWTNVGKAKSLFKGHYQPRVPADLGYYDLRIPEIREEQVKLAKEAGITAFCYWHYWFGNGKRLMNRIFDEVLDSQKPDFPFCLAWANHSWYAKTFNKDKSGNKLLIEQTYPGDEDIKIHFEFLNKAFKDKRYVKHEGRPIFVIYDPISMPENYIKKIQILAKESGWEKGLYIIANINGGKYKKEDFITKGYDCVTFQRLANVIFDSKKRTGKLLYYIKQQLKSFIFHYPKFAAKYKDCIPYLTNETIDSSEDVIPCIVPNWDHTPRSGMNGSMFLGESPRLFKKHAINAINITKNKKNKFIFLKSWNEWGEGNYMEPDLKFGKEYIYALRDAIKESLK